MPDEIKIVVWGDAKSGGSKRAYPHPKTGKPVIVETVKGAPAWKQEVRKAAADVMGDHPPLFGPIEATMVFFRARPKSHYGTGRNAERLKPNAPAFPTSKPDALKLARLAEDALTGICWRDDAQIVREHLGKEWGVPHVEILIWELEATISDGEGSGENR